MPSGDRTGPQGQGPMSGRGAGYCAGNDKPGYANPGGTGRGFGGLGRMFGRGRGGRGRGGGRGWRRRFYASGLTGWQRAAAEGTVGEPPQDAPGATETLREQLRSLEHAVEDVKRRLDSLDAAQGPKAS